MSITIFGKPNCPACETLKNKLKNNGQDFDYVDVSVDTVMREEMLAHGFRSVPQVQKNGEWVNVQEVI